MSAVERATICFKILIYIIISILVIVSINVCLGYSVALMVVNVVEALITVFGEGLCLPQPPKYQILKVHLKCGPKGQCF